MAGTPAGTGRNLILVVLQRRYFVSRDEHRLILPCQVWLAKALTERFDGLVLAAPHS
jgi:hypothetical protein